MRYDITKVDKWFLDKLLNLIKLEKWLAEVSLLLKNTI